MTYGIYEAAIEDVVTFVRNGGVLHRPVEKDLIAGEYSHCFIDTLAGVELYRDGCREDTRIVGASSWWDISRELIDPLETRLHRFSREPSDNINTKDFLSYVDDRDAEIASALRPRLELAIGWEEYFQVVLHLKDILIVRGLNGVTNNFAEWMFRVYKAGGHVAGYEGAYPHGRFVIYSRPEP